ncbi:MAG TPA: DUF1566 domain-containing protein [Desulfohalobiaceae bacterium]|nr:DUF1566 domain-containing protein [Desulfohalobiaceae bacterium]
MLKHILKTGQTKCFDQLGRKRDCLGSGEDAELGLGLTWPDPRFSITDSNLVLDRLTGLIWTLSANPFEFPMSWPEALKSIQGLNHMAYLGFTDWRLPNKRELRCLMDHGTSRPSLPRGNPFQHVVQTWYWTSTTSAMYLSYAWYGHLEGSRMFWGRKDRDYLVWPVRGKSEVLPMTGEVQCFDLNGQAMDCKDSGADGEVRAGMVWPEQRFKSVQDGILDRLTGLVWTKQANVGEASTWSQALNMIEDLRHKSGRAWHLPNINELESLVDASSSSPALPLGHPFQDVQEVYWSSTSSGLQPDWSYALYMFKGAVGVGQKEAKFAVWPALLP